MAQRWNGWRWQLGLASALAMGGAIITSPGERVLAQQIKPDNTLGSESSILKRNIFIRGLPSDRIDGGAKRGANLFHSFKEFDVEEGRGAYFKNPAGIENILGRVTGGSRSDIQGTLGVLGNANLFLINPKGIIFGPNSSLDVKGSFVATTANAVQFDNQDFFSASDPNVPSLLTVNPSAFLFNQIAAQPVKNQSSFLQVPLGRSLLLLGGDVSLEKGIFGFGGFTSAPGGRIELGGLAGAGTVGLNVEGSNLRLSFPEDIERANVSLSDGASVDVTGGGGSIAINAQNLSLTEGSFLQAGIYPPGLGYQAGDIEINATGALRVSESNIFNNVPSGAVGKAGNISITAESLEVTDGAQLQTLTRGEGDAGSVNINARDSVSFDKGSRIYSTVESGATGNGGDIDLTARSIDIKNGAQLQALTRGKGDAGNVNINARNNVLFDGVGSDELVSGAYSSVEDTATGNANAGNVNIKAKTLFVTNGAQIQSVIRGQEDAGSVTEGDAGSVNINARDSISFDKGSGIYSTLGAGIEGNAGNINIKTGSLDAKNGAALSSSLFGYGDAGDVNINARDSISFDEESRIYSTVEDTAIGKVKGGNINITTGSLAVTNGSRLDSGTSGKGDAGIVNIDARDRVSFGGGVGSDGLPTAALSNVEEGAEGNAGNVNIKAGSLAVTNGALLESRTRGEGDAGNVNINARDTVSFDGVGDGWVSGAYSSVENKAIGNGGNVKIKTGSLSLIRGANLQTQTAGAGNAGNVLLQADNEISLDDSIIFSTVEPGAVGKVKGGNVKIKTESLSLTGGAQLQTLTRGKGDAGNVNINARNNVLFDGVSSDGFPSTASSYVEEGAEGNGGVIDITAGSLALTNGGGLFASSLGNGAAGSIKVEASSIGLDKGAFLNVDTIAGQGNINLHSQNLLVLSRGSNITTDATGTATGGNITIDTGVLVALENSDISANALEGPGGRVSISAQGIFGTEFREAETSESDITATSELGPEFSGTVELNTPDVDPSQGIVALPEEVVDVSGLVAQKCPAGGGTVARKASKFVVTGRGGLPPDPTDPPSSDVVLADWIMLDTKMEEPRSGPAPAIKSTSSEAAPIVEAQGWVRDSKGQVVLTAQTSTVTPRSSELAPASCPVDGMDSRDGYPTESNLKYLQ